MITRWDGKYCPAHTCCVPPPGLGPWEFQAHDLQNRSVQVTVRMLLRGETGRPHCLPGGLSHSLLYGLNVDPILMVGAGSAGE